MCQISSKSEVFESPMIFLAVGFLFLFLLFDSTRLVTTIPVPTQILHDI